VSATDGTAPGDQGDPPPIAEAPTERHPASSPTPRP
jgi:hypothetical protein